MGEATRPRGEQNGLSRLLLPKFADTARCSVESSEVVPLANCRRSKCIGHRKFHCDLHEPVNDTGIMVTSKYIVLRSAYIPCLTASVFLCRSFTEGIMNSSRKFRRGSWASRAWAYSSLEALISSLYGSGVPVFESLECCWDGPIVAIYHEYPHELSQ